VRAALVEDASDMSGQRDKSDQVFAEKVFALFGAGLHEHSAGGGSA
jgi:hypothetical protein